MRHHLFSLLVPLVLGCSGKHVVSGTDRPTAEEYRETLPAWCAKTCQRLAVCDDTCECAGDTCRCPGVGEDCPEECEESLGSYATSQACTDLASRYRNCIDTFDCEDLENPPACVPPREELEACEERDELDDPPASGTGGSSIGGAPSGQPPSAGGSASYGGSGPGLAPVTCLAGNGSGAAGTGTGGNGNAQVVCEETRTSCSDDHEYGYVCVDDAAGHFWCTCFLDGAPVGAFEPASSCAAIAELNTACGWNLRVD